MFRKVLRIPRQGEMSRVPFRVSTLVSTKWLSDKLVNRPKNFRIVDASWHLPSTKRNAFEEYKQRHIPSAQFFDLDGCCDKSSRYEHMLPSPSVFEDYIGKLGIDNKTHVVVYDTSNFALFSAQRLWWTFRVFGHTSVSLLEGGINQWINEGCETTQEIEQVQPATFKATFNPAMVKSFEDLERNLTEKKFTVVDARAAPRFEGTGPEPRPDIKPGHIPDSFNIPFPMVLNDDTKTVKTPEEIKEVFSKVGVDWTSPVVASCGSGVTACMLVLAAHLAGQDDVAVYDGAWVEWFLRAKDEHKVGTPP